MFITKTTIVLFINQLAVLYNILHKKCSYRIRTENTFLP